MKELENVYHVAVMVMQQPATFKRENVVNVCIIHLVKGN